MPTHEGNVFSVPGINSLFSNSNFAEGIGVTILDLLRKKYQET